MYATLSTLPGALGSPASWALMKYARTRGSSKNRSTRSRMLTVSMVSHTSSSAVPRTSCATCAKVGGSVSMYRYTIPQARSQKGSHSRSASASRSDSLRISRWSFWGACHPRRELPSGKGWKLHASSGYTSNP